MTIHSRWKNPIPEGSLQKYVFGSSSGRLSDKPIYLDPERPDTHFLTVNDYRDWSKRLALGLQRAGLKPGDRVLLFSGNNLFFPVVFMGVRSPFGFCNVGGGVSQVEPPARGRPLWKSARPSRHPQADPMVT